MKVVVVGLLAEGSTKKEFPWQKLCLAVVTIAFSAIFDVLPDLQQSL
jgi:hypothetical protein